MSSFASPLMLVHPAAVVHVAPAAGAAHPVVAHPMVVHQASNVMTANPNLIHWINPIFNLWAMPRPRTQFALPQLISPVPVPTDQTLFEEPQDATKKHYLPGFAIATTGSGIQVMQWVSLEPTGNTFQLVVHLAPTTAPALATGHVRIDAPTRYMLMANLQGRAASWDFATAVADGNNLKLTLPIADLATRNSIYLAMTDPAAQAKLVVRRSISAGIPVQYVPPPPTPGHPATAPPAPTFRLTTLAVDTSVPFTFSKDLDQNVFAQLDGAGGKPPAPWNIARVNWNQRPYVYYQDRSQPSQIYFLPDSFKIARDPKPPHTPRLIVATNGTDPGSVTLTLSYIAQSVWGADRIAAAAIALQQQLSLPAVPNLALFEATDTTLALKVPPADASSSVTLAPQNGVTIDIAAGVAGSVTLTLGQFQQVYDALFDEVSELLTGQVTVKVDDDSEAIPFIARASDMAGDIFDITSTFDPQANRMTCVLRNAIESPIHVDQISAVVTKAGRALANTMEQVSPGPPEDVAPGASLTITLQIAAGESIDNTTKAMFDFGGTHVTPNSKAIWQAIMNNQVVGPVARPVTVRLVASVIAPVAAAATAPSTQTPSPDAILAVQVVFESGQTATFDASLTPDTGGFINQIVKLAVPIEKFVLHEADSASYRYHVDVVTHGGPKKGDWVTDNADVLFVSVD